MQLMGRVQTCTHCLISCFTFLPCSPQQWDVKLPLTNGFVVVCLCEQINLYRRTQTIECHKICLYVIYSNLHIAACPRAGQVQLYLYTEFCRVVTKISSSRVNTTSRWGIKQLRVSFGSTFLLFSFESSRGPRS